MIFANDDPFVQAVMGEDSKYLPAQFNVDQALYERAFHARSQSDPAGQIKMHEMGAKADAIRQQWSEFAAQEKQAQAAAAAPLTPSRPAADSEEDHA